MPSSIMKSKESGGLSAFLKKKDPNLESLKTKYFEDESLKSSKSAYRPSDTQSKNYADVEDFIDK